MLLMELVFAYIAGLLTLINPCVLPVLPIVLASSLQASRWAPFALAAGMSMAFVTFGLLVVTFGHAFGIDENTIAKAGAVLMIIFAFVLLFPPLGHLFERLTSGLARRADSKLDGIDHSGLKGQFVGGALLGAVWSPCIGPTLGAAIALASGGGSLIWAGTIMSSFALGVSTLIIGIGYGTRSILMSHQALLRRIASVSRPFMGLMFLLIGLLIYFDGHKAIEIWAIQTLPFWVQELSVRF